MKFLIVLRSLKIQKFRAALLPALLALFSLIQVSHSFAGIKSEKKDSCKARLTGQPSLAKDPSVPTTEPDQASIRRTLELGALEFSPKTNLSQIVEFGVNPNDQSFVLHLTSQAEQYFYIHRLIDPEGNEVIGPIPEHIHPELLNHPAIAGRTQILSANGVWPSVFQGVSSVLVPNHPSVQVKPGTWKVQYAFESQQNVPIQEAIEARLGAVFKSRLNDKKVNRRRLTIQVFATQASGVGASI